MFILNLLFINIFFISCDTQDGKVQKIETEQMVSMMNSIVSIEVYNTDSFAVSVFKKGNESESAGKRGTDEISYSYLLAISEFDEYPVQSLFEVGGFYNPSIDNTSIGDTTIRFEFTHGVFGDRKTSSITIGLHTVELR